MSEFEVIRQMDAAQLRDALKAENHRIAGANEIRGKIQMGVILAGITIFAVVPLLAQSTAVVILCLECWLAFFLSTKKSEHPLFPEKDGESAWEAGARLALWAALERRERESATIQAASRSADSEW